MGKGQSVGPKLHWCVPYLLSPHSFAHILSSGSCQIDAGNPFSAMPKSSGWTEMTSDEDRFLIQSDIHANCCRSDSFAESITWRSRELSHGNPQGQLASRSGRGPVCRRCLERAQDVTSGTESKAVSRDDACSHDNDDTICTSI